MTSEQILTLGKSFSQYLQDFRRCFSNRRTFEHLKRYGRGLLSDLSRKSVEPIALACGCAVRTLQEFLAHHKWDHNLMRDEIQRRVVRDHLPAPDAPGRLNDGIGVVCRVEETSVAKKGDKTPGVQRQHCGASGKHDNGIVTVHLDVAYGPTFRTLLDSDLYLPEKTWHDKRDRCRAAHIPDHVVYRPKWQIAIEQVKRALGNGVRFDWMTFDEGYGMYPQFLYELDGLGQMYVAEVPPNFRCWPSYPAYNSPQAPFVAKEARNAVVWGKPFKGKPFKRFTLARQTTTPQVWEAKAAQVWLQKDGRYTEHTCRPTDRTYWLIIARNVLTGEIKYFVSNAPPKAELQTLLKVAFCRWGIEHVFRVAKSEIGFDHFEGRSYLGLMRHMILCQLVMLFVAGQTLELREKKREPGTDDGTDGSGVKSDLPSMAPATLCRRTSGNNRRDHPLPSTEKRGRAPLKTDHYAEVRVAL
jgi:SRSO17 transposase